MKYKILTLSVILSFIFISFTMNSGNGTSIGVENTLIKFRENSVAFTLATRHLVTALESIRKDDPLSVYQAKKALKDCRLAYKRIEFFTEYFFPSETRMYNAAPKYEVEEPTLEFVEPMGLQQIETLLFEDDVMANKPALLAQADALYTSVSDLRSLLYRFEASDQQILESLRIELLRIITLSISGYDAPFLKSGISETLVVTEIFREVLKPYLDKDLESGRQLNTHIENALSYLKIRQDFDSFNRMEYLQKFALPMQKELAALIRSLDLELVSTQFLNYDSDHIFSPDALKPWGWELNSSQGQKLFSLGKKLFFDKALSADLSTSCASCHQPQNFFADALKRSPALHADSILKRNTPSLLYAGWQHTQFWDGRANNLEEQIKNVVFNPLEMNGKMELLYQNILLNDTYQAMFQEAFPEKATKDMGIDEIARAISVFVKQLSPMNSPFDRYMQGDKTALSESQIKGFNLFMGKAQCGTCHFPPFFNSLLPPLYELSEVEILGTTQTDDFDHPVYDDDLGRFDLYQVRYYKRAFKTPTVRNAEKTSPYMHNGAFKSLKSVLDFYNRGGGNGLGLHIDDQSLSSKPLNLSENEIDHIIQFIHSLTDSINYSSNNLN